ncbi:MAG: TraB/GumN family protein, partial [Bacteroidota bacterium]
MKTRCLLLFLFVTAILQAQENRNFIWEISGKDLKEKSYLFGSMHLNVPEIFKISDSTMLALQSCEVFASEVDFGAIDSILIDEIVNEKVKEETEPDEAISDAE